MHPWGELPFCLFRRPNTNRFLASASVPVNVDQRTTTRDNRTPSAPVKPAIIRWQHKLLSLKTCWHISCLLWQYSPCNDHLVPIMMHKCLNNLADILQTTFSNVFFQIIFSRESFVSWFRFHRRLFSRITLTTCQQCLRHSSGDKPSAKPMLTHFTRFQMCFQLFMASLIFRITYPWYREKITLRQFSAKPPSITKDYDNNS